MRVLPTAGAVLLAAYVAACTQIGVVRAEPEYTPADTLAAIEQYTTEFHVPYRWVYDVVACETGGTFSNYLVGRAGEVGAVQLHPRGELPRFYDWGYLDPHSPWQSVRFLVQRYLYGGQGAWSCA